MKDHTQEPLRAVDGAVMASMALLLMIITTSSGIAAAQSDDLGRRFYRQYCSACHGPNGHGDGVVSQFMRPRPADLTQLAHNAGGRFPFYDVIRSIDGRETVRAHGDPDMPVWGTILDSEEPDAPGRHEVAHAKITLIADYLRTIQVK